MAQLTAETIQEKAGDRKRSSLVGEPDVTITIIVTDRKHTKQKKERT